MGHQGFLLKISDRKDKLFQGASKECNSMTWFLYRSRWIQFEISTSTNCFALTAMVTQPSSVRVYYQAMKNDSRRYHVI